MITNEKLPEAIMKEIFLHDNHKLTGRPHPRGHSLPYNVDRRSADLSRRRKPPSSPGETSHYRMSFIHGDCYSPETYNIANLVDVETTLNNKDEQEIHRLYLGKCGIDGINESQYFPYTSLKYHCLLAASLYVNSFHKVREIFLVADVDPDDLRTIFSTDGVTLALLPEEEVGERPASKMWPREAMNFGNVWSRMTGWVIDDQSIEMNLRRMKSWSTTLHYLEESL